MHLNWKYRELVTIICKERSLQAVNEVARTLEAESGGILVAVERVRKGYAIIIYCGKNYQRPSCSRPPTLLSKREAMKRSLEAQCRESLKLYVLWLTKNVNDLKRKLAQDENAPNMQPFDEEGATLSLVLQNNKSSLPKVSSCHRECQRQSQRDFSSGSGFLAGASNRWGFSFPGA